MNYKIGNLIIDSDKALNKGWECFAYDKKPINNEELSQDTENSAQKIVIKVQHIAQISEAEKAQGLTVNHPQFRTTQLKDGWIYEFKADSPSKMRVDKAYTQVQITEGDGKEYLLRLAVECRLILEGFISLHGACVISPNGEAIIFTGNSGVGKSTRAAAWKNALCLEMISGDRPLIDTKKFIAYGVPWDGKEGIYVNLKAPISIIFNVVRAEEDECQITKISGFEALKVLLAQTFMPMWDTDLAALAMENLNQLINSNIKVADLVSSWDEIAALRAWEETKKLEK